MLSSMDNLKRWDFSLLRLDPSGTVIPGALAKAIPSDLLVCPAPMVRHRTHFGNPYGALSAICASDKDGARFVQRRCCLWLVPFLPQDGLTLTDCEEVLPFWPA
jgi:hypothetical protein